jgi:uncharacterized protein (DUF2336 family)
MGVSHLRANLNEADVRMLVRGETEDDRALAAHRLCRRIDAPTLSDTDRAYAAEILRFILQDTGVQVRRALAITLKHSRNLPVDVAKKLATDVEAVAVPVLEASPVLSDHDLAEILAICSAPAQMAVTRRASLGEEATEALAKYGTEEAVHAGLRHPLALFSESGLRISLDRFDASEKIQSAMIGRDSLPPAITEKLVNLVTGSLFDTLVNRHALPPQLAIDLTTKTRERITIDLASQAMLQPDPRRFVQQLHLNGRLTPSLVLRALCQGATTFVEHAFAELAGVPHSKAWLLFHDAGPMGLRALFERSGMPPKLYTAFRTAVDTLHETEFDGGADDRARFTQRLIERVLTRQPDFPGEELAYLLDRLDAGERAQIEGEVRKAG